MTDSNILLHEKTFAIAWGDMDALGHVNNARYFDYFQEARIEWLQTLNLDLRQSEGPVVIHVGCTFLKPVVYPAQVTIQSKMLEVGRSSMLIGHDLYQAEELMAQGSSKIVWVNYKQNKSVPLPEIILSMKV